MAVQAQLYPETFCLPLSSGLQDYWMVNNPVSGFEPDCCFSFQQSQQQNLFLQQQSSQNFGFDNNRATGTGVSSSSSQSTCDSFISMALDARHLEMQRREVDCILQVQNERLRSSLQELRKQQLGVLLKSVESKAISLMRQKEEDLAQATKKTMGFEACLRKAQAKRESWQRQARANEAMVIDLSNTLEQVRERLVLENNIGQDTESFCCGSCEREKEKEGSIGLCLEYIKEAQVRDFIPFVTTASYM
ncbi:uncharacterized protein LOC105635310 [Jatropha curcas]|uniref:uncharacterized protein LOC105635310 n=1 Tax=Jatropha curcas TaxID=180498 RepID=UPI001894AF5F|nr:uncharacterized protein LOC105635310 [Jatropha curcas]